MSDIFDMGDDGGLDFGDIAVIIAATEPEPVLSYQEQTEKKRESRDSFLLWGTLVVAVIGALVAILAVMKNGGVF